MRVVFYLSKSLSCRPPQGVAAAQKGLFKRAALFKVVPALSHARMAEKVLVSIYVHRQLRDKKKPD